MGCFGSVKKTSQSSEVADATAVTNFLDDGNLERLWIQFDSNGDGYIDGDKFKNLVYVSLKFFCTERSPDRPPPTHEEMEPFINKLVEQLRPCVDKDRDIQITKEEFASYGTYLTNEFKKLQKELKGSKQHVVYF